jgi:hypothetical protein
VKTALGAYASSVISYQNHRKSPLPEMVSGLFLQPGRPK